MEGGEGPRFLTDGDRRYGVWLFDLGLACCAAEYVAAGIGGGLPDEVGEPFAMEPRDADVLVVSGTVTDRTAAAVLRAYDQLRPPRLVVSFGACAASGGPYWDSYSVTKGIGLLVPVTRYVPGCPPRPEALVDALRDLLGTEGPRG